MLEHAEEDILQNDKLVEQYQSVDNLRLLEFFEKDDFKCILVNVLSQRPKQSATTEGLIKEVIKRCHILTRQAVRAKFVKKIKESINSLARSEILEKYHTNKNARIRLDREYKTRCLKAKLFYSDEHVDKILQRVYAQEKKFGNYDFPDDRINNYYRGVDENQESQTEKSISQIGLEIPDIFSNLVIKNSSKILEDEDYEKNNDNFNNRSFEDKLNNLLTEERSCSADKGEGFQKRENIKADGVLFEDILQQLKGLNWLRIQSINQICHELNISLEDKDIEILLNFYLDNNLILLRSYFNYQPELIGYILEVSGDIDFSSTIGVSLQKGNRVLVVRRKVQLFDLKSFLILLKEYLADIYRVHEVLHA